AWPTKDTKSAHCHNCVHSSLSYRKLLVRPGLTLIILGVIILGLLLSRNGINCLRHPIAAYEPGTLHTAEVLRDPITRAPVVGACYQSEWRINAGISLATLECLLVGLISAVYGYVLDNREGLAAKLEGWQPPVPLTPHLRGVIVRELMEGHITLMDDGTYTAAKTNHKGTIDPRLEFTSMDQRRVSLYRKKYQVPTRKELPFHAGFLHLVGKPHISVRYGNSSLIRAANILPLVGQTGDYPYLSGQRGWAYRRVDLVWPYEIDENPRGKWSPNQAGALPVRLALTLEEEATRQVLGLEIQVPASLAGTDIEKVTLRYLRLQIPITSLGEPTALQPEAIVTLEQTSDEIVHCNLVWEDLPFDLAEIREGRKQFSIHFPGPVMGEITVQGTFMLQIEPAPSNIKEIRLYSPLGYPIDYSDSNMAPIDTFAPFQIGSEGNSSSWRKRIRNQFGTIVESIKTKLAFHKAPLQDETTEGTLESTSETEPEPTLFDLLNMPPVAEYRVESEDEASTLMQFDKKEKLISHNSLQLSISFDMTLARLMQRRRSIIRRTISLGRIAPNYQTISCLLNTLAWDSHSNQPNPNYHVRSVVENPPQVTRSQSNTTKRLWDISGRRYHRVYPVDFHVVVMGEEVRGKEDQMPTGRTVVELTVQGGVSTMEMERIISQAAQEIEDLIKASINNG
ncbi:hypothetical protein, partial [Nitrosomonas nitrosa]|uniref:hypothetical protein n=1 Tax=Nitrosomonas nitrosa TaxID=52442 RepID=UPI0023F8CD75